MTGITGPAREAIQIGSWLLTLPGLKAMALPRLTALRPFLLRPLPHRRRARACLGALVLAMAGLSPASLASADRTRQMPAYREGGGSRGGCQARRLAQLVAPSGRFAPGPEGRIAVLEMPSADPAPLVVHLEGLEPWRLPPQPAAVRLLTIPPPRGDQLWESYPLCEKAIEGFAAPPARAWLVPSQPDPSEQQADRLVRHRLRDLGHRCGGTVATPELLAAFALQHLQAYLPDRLPVVCSQMSASTTQGL